MIVDIQKIKFFNAAAKNWNETISELNHQALQNALSDLNYQSQDIVLDIGCGTGVLFPYLKKQKVIGLDFSIEMLQNVPHSLCTSNVSLFCADVHAIPLRTNSVNHAICFSALPHFSDFIIAFKEIHRVLKSGGTLTILHLAEPEVINNIHKSIGGPIADDLLPDITDVRRMLEEYFIIKKLVVNLNLFFVQSVKII